MNKPFIYGMQALFVICIAIGSQTLNVQYAGIHAARFALYLLTLNAIAPICELVESCQATGKIINTQKLAADGRDYVIAYVGALAVLLYYRESPFKEDFTYVGLAYLVFKYPEMVRRPFVDIVSWSSHPSINYGVGMACSFFEGYLVHIIPSDGAKFIGFQESIVALENSQGVLFPSKKLFIIITKNLFCPPDLNDFKQDNDQTYLEAFNALENVQKSVAGVKDRIYRNTAYKIYRPRGAPVCVMAECATPLHTLHRVLNNRTLYEEVANIDVASVVEDFCRTLRSIIDKSPQCRGKCELVYYDNEDPDQNLGDILLNRIRELAPDFEERIIARKAENVVDDNK